MIDVTTKSKQLVERWKAAKNNVMRINRELNAAVSEKTNAANELGKWLVPPDQEAGIPFNIWYGSGILQAIRKNANDYDVVWRKEPDGKDRLEYGV